MQIGCTQAEVSPVSVRTCLCAACSALQRIWIVDLIPLVDVKCSCINRYSLVQIMLQSAKVQRNQVRKNVKSRQDMSSTENNERQPASTETLREGEDGNGYPSQRT